MRLSRKNAARHAARRKKRDDGLDRELAVSRGKRARDIAMTTYIYETTDNKAGVAPRIYEIRQSMKEAPLTVHPQTGEAIRRVITGGYGLITKTEGKFVGTAGSHAEATPAHNCGTGCCCGH